MGRREGAVKSQALMASSECDRVGKVVVGDHPLVMQVGFRIPPMPEEASVRTRASVRLVRHGISSKSVPGILGWNLGGRKGRRIRRKRAIGPTATKNDKER
jgi:hypothetical protein